MKWTPWLLEIRCRVDTIICILVSNVIEIVKSYIALQVGYRRPRLNNRYIRRLSQGRKASSSGMRALWTPHVTSTINAGGFGIPQFGCQSGIVKIVVRIRNAKRRVSEKRVGGRSIAGIARAALVDE
jgi:hypothetical protein